MSNSLYLDTLNRYQDSEIFDPFELNLSDNDNIVEYQCELVPARTISIILPTIRVKAVTTVYPKKYAHGFVVLCFVVVMQSFIMNSHEVFIHIHQGCLLALGQSLDCHSASEVSLMDMGKSVNV